MNISLEERGEWLWETIQRLASLLKLRDEEFEYAVFEELDIDVRSALHRTNVEDLIKGALLSAPVSDRVESIRATAIALIDDAYASGTTSASALRKKRDWILLCTRCQELLVLRDETRVR